MSRKIKVGVIGSCVSRDVFNSKFINNYKDIYECVSTAWQSSIISFVSKSVPEVPKDLNLENIKSRHRQNTVLRDLTKPYRDEMIDIQPDYIIFDLYADVRYGTVKYADSCFTDNPNGLRHTDFYKNTHFDEKINYRVDKNRFFKMLMASLDDLLEWLNNNLPQTKLLLNQFKYTDVYINEANEMEFFSKKKYRFLDKENKIYGELYEIIKQKYPDIDFIRQDINFYTSDGAHAFGVSPWHFSKKYYVDFFSQLNEIVLKDIVENELAL
ncbi:hypothetical protein JOD45_002114 [Scopulibacillus daqui]|uniref:Polysaccharide biosynthesis enzyme WcbI domain-containing protein n=1 Tax=Scopulibacillus daqui TaxID=1469162 RepID=A0ABS2Q2F6_9BACL|nr:DUF6270 domain-containing protein [Scopulibacillus daqui]MBM7645889.1 hypothetical protein [Scopulibacillus daqui]